MSYLSQILTKTSQVCFARLQKETYSEVEWLYEDLHNLLELRPKKDVLFIIGDWNRKVENQEICGVPGKFGLGTQMIPRQRIPEFCERIHWSQQTTFSNNTGDDSTHGHHQMTNIKIQLITFFAAEDGEAL